MTVPQRQARLQVTIGVAGRGRVGPDGESEGLVLHPPGPEGSGHRPGRARRHHGEIGGAA